MRVIALPEVREYLMELINVLYEKEYFGFEENAQKYVEELFLDIKNNLPLKLKKPAPPYFDRYGKKMLYSTFRKNKATQWYVFFNVYQKDGEITFIIRYTVITMLRHNIYNCAIYCAFTSIKTSFFKSIV